MNRPNNAVFLNSFSGNKSVSGLGGVARLLMLPEESHGYRSRESVLHMLYEQSEWIERYVKNAEQISSN